MTTTLQTASADASRRLADRRRALLGATAALGFGALPAWAGAAWRWPATTTRPGLDGVLSSQAWLNTPGGAAPDIGGRPLLLLVWTYSCINSLRVLPAAHGWLDRYASAGLQVVGVHAPEFAFERNPAQVAAAIAEQDVRFAVALDPAHAVWRQLGNRWWPCVYLFDGQRALVWRHVGEDSLEKVDAAIRRLLAVPAAQPGSVAARVLRPEQAPASAFTGRSAETYLGHARAERFASPGGLRRDVPHRYPLPALPDGRDAWGLDGVWTVGAESVSAPAGEQPGTAEPTLYARFRARDLHLVMGAPSPVRFELRIDGRPPGSDHGGDVAADGSGTVQGHRLYQLLRQAGPVRERRVDIRFLDGGVQLYALTFG